MSSDGNTVNIENAKRPYHHGDLRAALLKAGLDLLETQSAESLSLREIARQVGVSPTAVYRHFPNKQSLLYALCEHAADGLYAAQDAAMKAAGGGPAGFAATGQAYVRYALANPALFRLLMTTKPPVEMLDPDETYVDAAMALLRRNVATVLPPGAPADLQMAAVTLAWSQVHGMAMLMLDGQIPADEKIISAIGRAAPF